MEYSYKGYYKNYYDEHKEQYRGYMKKYLNKNKTAIIYKILSEKDEMMYIGSTDSKFRLNYHKNGYGKLDKSKGEKLLYSKINGITREELYFIESYLIEKYNPPKNLSIVKTEQFGINECRKVELIKIADDLQFNFFKLN
ncbi:hypothetical protein RBU49_03010 [Clostridium sp. MB40-C1]|uniref:GIY-YIG nuclease family protein n=1 Tax=Clostridium sp. MB40-C1 TaxID=3070996 RepID=UPI0027DF66D4|nr:GIY-YIG nuclease family protein [Clostridium sp. MB40-C1]WMJ81240.1 hypothetical protein RBU49_03010 [Clostridium sp. MB40-C1]